jgi:hypothetical protein
LKNVALNIAMEPLFTPITPMDAIQGYNDEFLEKMRNKSILELGSLTLDPWVSIDTPNYAQKFNSSVVMETG